MWWTSRSGKHGAIDAAKFLAAVVVALLLTAPEPALAVRQDGPVVLYTRGAGAQAAKKEVGGSPAPSQGKKGAKAPNPLAVKPPTQPADPPDRPKGKAAPEPAPLPIDPQADALKGLGEQGQVDPISGLGLRNPACDALNEIRDRLTRLACELNGTPESNYPPTNYGFDTFIDSGIDSPLGNGLSIIVWLLNGIWLGVNFILRCVFELLGLAFGLNPFGNGETMRQISGSIGRIYSRITGPWLSTLIVMAGIWFAYKGLVRREIGASVSGTLAAVAMLVFGLWIVHSPGQTVGRVANMSNEVSLGIISAPHTGSISRPMGSFAEAMSRTWPRLIEVPFAGLNFSDVSWAMGPPPAEAVEKANEKLCDDVGTQALFEASEGSDGDVDKACEEFVQNRYGKPKRVIDLYLRSSPNSPPREALWQYFDKDEADLYKAKVAAQGGDGVLTRLSMLALFLVGLFGALMLLAWLALRLFTQAAIGFVLLMAAPFALFFPLLGDSGRRAFKTWGLTLLGATLAKVVYAAFLSVVLMGITTLGRPGGAIGFLLASAFCWAVFLKRAELIKWLSVGDTEAMRSLSVPSQIAALALGRRVWRTATGVAGGVVGVRRGQMSRQGQPPPRGSGRPGERRDGTRRSNIQTISSSARGLSDRHLAEARQTVAETRRKYGDPKRWKSKPPRAEAVAAEEKSSSRAPRVRRNEPSPVERVRYEKAQALIAHADRELQIRGGRGGAGPAQQGIEAESLERPRPGSNPTERMRRAALDRERPEETRDPTRPAKERAGQRTLRDAHLLHAAMEASDPTLARASQMIEGAQENSEEKRSPRRGNVRRVSRFRQLQRSDRERKASHRQGVSRKGMSRGATSRGAKSRGVR